MSANSQVDAKAQKRAKFEHVWNVIRDELVEYFSKQGMPKEATEWYAKVCCLEVTGIRNEGY